MLYSQQDKSSILNDLETRREPDVSAPPNWFQTPRAANSRRPTTRNSKAAFTASELQQEALHDLFLTSREKFVRIAYRILCNSEDAEDAVQDAFLSACRSLREFEGRSSVATWFTRIVMNAALMVRRKREKLGLRPLNEFCVEGSVFFAEIPDVQPNPELDYSRRESFQMLDVLLDKLNPLLREAVTMTYYQELSTLEASSVLGVPPSTFKARLFRGRRLLQQRAEDITVS